MYVLPLWVEVPIVLYLAHPELQHLLGGQLAVLGKGELLPLALHLEGCGHGNRRTQQGVLTQEE